MEASPLSNMTPLVIHDLQDSQMFALAQAAGRAGIPVCGTSNPLEAWVLKSRYVQKAVEIRSLSEVHAGMFALQLKRSGLQGIWLPCVDDIVGWTAQHHTLVRSFGFRFLVPDISDIEKARGGDWLESGKLRKPQEWRIADAELPQKALELPYPVLLKTTRGRYLCCESAEDLLRFRDQQASQGQHESEHRLQAYISGGVERMASAILLFDGEGRVVRGFTARRQRVENTKFGPFGESTAVCAEWIPELYEGAKALLSQLHWRGFAEVECKQAADGSWYVLEVNARLSGWSCLAEADGAGLLQAYYALCTGKQLEEACLQKSTSRYVRMVATCYHEPDWNVPKPETLRWGRRFVRIWQRMREYRRVYPYLLAGAWDMRDLRASVMIAWSTVKRVWRMDRHRPTGVNRPG